MELSGNRLEQKSLFHPLTLIRIIRQSWSGGLSYSRRIKGSWRMANGQWRMAVPLHKINQDDISTKNHKLFFRYRGMLLCQISQLTMEKMNCVTWWWCCSQAYCEFIVIGIKTTTNRQTIKGRESSCKTGIELKHECWGSLNSKNTWQQIEWKRRLLTATETLMKTSKVWTILLRLC